MANFHPQSWFMDNLQHHLDLVKGAGYNIAAIFYLGSGNYGMDIESSDFDSIAFVIPSVRDFVRNEKFLSNLIPAGNGEIKIKDIRHLPQMILNQNPADLQIFISVAKWNNPEYEGTFREIMKWREVAFNWNPNKFLMAVRSQAFKALGECYRRYGKEGESSYCWKKASIVYRCLDYVQKFLKEKYLYMDYMWEITDEWDLAYGCKIKAQEKEEFTLENYSKISTICNDIDRLVSIYCNNHDFNHNELSDDLYQLIGDIIWQRD